MDGSIASAQQPESNARQACYCSKCMVLRQIELDEETDRILAALASDYEGDTGLALSELLRAHEGIEAVAADCEGLQSETLRAQKERSEQALLEGRYVTWDEVNRQNSL